MKYLIIIIMACSLYAQPTKFMSHLYIETDSTGTITAWDDTIYLEKDLNCLWYNYQFNRNEYRVSFNDKVAIMLIPQYPRSLKIYKWLRKKDYSPIESARRTNIFLDKEHKKSMKRINKVLEDK